MMLLVSKLCLLSFVIINLLNIATSMILEQNALRALCHEAQSKKVDQPEPEIVDHFMRRYSPRIDSGSNNENDRTIDRQLLRSLMDEFTGTASLNRQTNYVYPFNSRSIVAKYKVVGAKGSAADISNFITTDYASMNADNSITIRQSHDKLLKSKVKKLIIIAQPAASTTLLVKGDNQTVPGKPIEIQKNTIKRLKRSPKIFENKSTPKHTGNDNKKTGSEEKHQRKSSDTQSKQVNCDNIHLEKAMDSTDPVEWWTLVRKIRDQINTI